MKSRASRTASTHPQQGDGQIFVSTFVSATSCQRSSTCANVNLHSQMPNAECQNAQMHKCTNAQMHKCTDAKCTNAECQMLNAKCWMPNAGCQMLDAKCTNAACTKSTTTKCTSAKCTKSTNSNCTNAVCKFPHIATIHYLPQQVRTPTGAQRLAGRSCGVPRSVVPLSIWHCHCHCHCHWCLTLLTSQLHPTFVCVRTSSLQQIPDR